MIDKKQIKNIIFDLGGVILNVDFYLTNEEFKKLGVKNFNKLYSQLVQTNLFKDFEKGIISVKKFHDKFRKITGISISDYKIDKAWNSMIGDFPLQRIRLLENLRKKYKIFLLSNTNKIHYNLYIKRLEKEYRYKKFSELFEKSYLSFNIGMRKPDKEIFDFVVTQNNIKPKETLFIDDSFQNTESAKQTGLKTYLLSKKEDITDVFLLY
jgi:putative hydrolase of the HAD superfamily